MTEWMKPEQSSSSGEGEEATLVGDPERRMDRA